MSRVLLPEGALATAPGQERVGSPYTGGIQKHGALLPHSWIREAPLKGLEGGDFGIYKGKNTTANGRQASKARGGGGGHTISPPSRPPPTVSPPPPLRCGAVVGCFPPFVVVWCGCGLLPPSLCGVVRVWALVVPPLPPLWRGVGWVVPPACLDLLGVFGKPMLMMILMLMMMRIVMIIIIAIILVFLWLVVGYLLPTCLLTIIALLTVGARSL